MSVPHQENIGKASGRGTGTRVKKRSSACRSTQADLKNRAQPAQLFRPQAGSRLPVTGLKGKVQVIS